MKQAHDLQGAEDDRFAGLEAEAVQTERREAWERQLARLARLVPIDLTHLPARKSDPHKVLLATALKQSTSVSNRWLAARLDMGKPSSVSQFAGRLLRQSDGKLRVRSLLSKVET